MFVSVKSFFLIDRKMEVLKSCQERTLWVHLGSIKCTCSELRSF